VSQACVCKWCIVAHAVMLRESICACLLPRHGHVLQQLVHSVRHKLEGTQVDALVMPKPGVGVEQMDI
jgi:hypothetical protein